MATFAALLRTVVEKGRSLGKVPVGDVTAALGPSPGFFSSQATCESEVAAISSSIAENPIVSQPRALNFGQGEVKRTGRHSKTNLTFLRSWGMGTAGLKKLKNNSFVARVHPETVERKIRWLMKEYGLDAKEVLHVVHGFPPFLGCSVENNVQPFLLSLMEDGCSKAAVKKMMVRFPPALGLAKKFEATYRFFEDSLGLTRQEFRKLVVRFPRVLSYSLVSTSSDAEFQFVDGKLKRTRDFFLDFGFSKEQLKHMLVVSPQFLNISLEGNIKEKLDKLLATGLQQEQVIKVVYSATPLLWSDFDKLFEKIEWLRDAVGFSHQEVLEHFVTYSRTFVVNLETWKANRQLLISWGLEASEVVDMFKRFPWFVSRNTESLSAKYDFAKNVLKREHKEICSSPRYFQSSFERVVLFRVAFLHKMGVDFAGSSLVSLVVQSEAKFRSRYGPRNVEAFESWWELLTGEEKYQYTVDNISPA